MTKAKATATAERAMMMFGQVLSASRRRQPQNALRILAKTNRRAVVAELYKHRFTVMCVPGEHDDGSDAGWHVYDRRSRTSSKVGTGTAGEALAIRTAHEANRVVALPSGLRPCVGPSARMPIQERARRRI